MFSANKEGVGNDERTKVFTYRVDLHWLVRLLLCGYFSFVWREYVPDDLNHACYFRSGYTDDGNRGA